MSTNTPYTHRSSLSVKCRTFSHKFNSQSQQSMLSSINIQSQTETISLFRVPAHGKFCFQNRIDKRQNYLGKLYRAMVYVRKETNRDTIDDGILAEELYPHINLSTNPTSKTELGEKLLSNGYILVALSILMGRIYSSQLVFGYLMGFFDALFNISDNLEDFKHYLLRSLDSFGITNAYEQQTGGGQSQTIRKVVKRTEIGSKTIGKQKLILGEVNQNI